MPEAMFEGRGSVSFRWRYPVEAACTCCATSCVGPVPVRYLPKQRLGDLMVEPAACMRLSAQLQGHSTAKVTLRQVATVLVGS